MGLTDLHLLSATEAARLIRDGIISSEQFVEACLARICEIDPQVQAWAFLDPDHALAQARAADVLRLSGQPIGPLYGVPVAIKDIFDTADMPTEYGSPIYAGRTPSRDATVVSLLRAAGAMIIGKTVTTEFAYFSLARRAIRTIPSILRAAPERFGGRCRRGYGAARDRQPDQRLDHRPAAYCGVVGFKPTHGLISRHRAFALSRTLDHVGLFARSIDDIALLAEQLIGCDENDPDTRPWAHVGTFSS